MFDVREPENSATLSGAQAGPCEITDLARNDVGREVASATKKMTRDAFGKADDRVGERAPMFALDVGGDQRFDRVGDESGVLGSSSVEIRIAAGTTTEEKLERVVVVVHPVEVCEKPEFGSLAPVARLEVSIGHGLEKAPARFVDESEVQLAFGREVLIEHGFGDTCCFSDIVHRCLVVPVTREDVECDIQELFAARGGCQTGGHGMVTVAAGHTFWVVGSVVP